MVLLVVDTQKAITNIALYQFELFEKNVNSSFRDTGLVEYLREKSENRNYIN